MKQQLLMCAPDHFEVQYAINPWMKDHIGEVNLSRAQNEWKGLYRSLQTVADIHLLESQPQVPDMVFTANAGLLAEGLFFPSQFKHQQRRLEEPFFREWFAQHSFDLVPVPDGIYFEGAGDVLVQPDGQRVWAGYGFRTDLEAHAFLQDRLEKPIISLKLIDPHFYHLDTCFCPLWDDHILYYPAALDTPSQKHVENILPPDKRIAVYHKDAEQFACNAVLVEDRLYMNAASPELQEQLKRKGYEVVVQPVHEFLKAGGGTKCLTLGLN